MKILITGATGVIGRRVVPLLTTAGYDVTAAVRSAEKASSVEQAGAHGLIVDLFDTDAVREAVSGQHAVINLATHLPASSASMLFPGAWAENDRIRREASANLVQAAIDAGVYYFIQESFAPIYLDAGDEWIDETSPVAPVRYNQSVIQAEASVAKFSAAGGVGITLRFGAFYGPDAFQTRDMIQSLRFGWAPIPGRPEAYISSVSHDDAAEAVVAAFNVPAGVYNVVDDGPVTRRDYFNALAGAAGLKEPHLLPAWTAWLLGSLGEMLARSLRISNRKFREASGWVPWYPSVVSGFPATIQAMEADSETSLDGVV